MKRILSVSVAAILIFGLSACGEKKPPQPGAYLGKKVLSAVRDLEHAYEKKDSADFMGQVSKTYAGREALERAVKQTFSKYEIIRFTFERTKMLVMVPIREDIKAEITWDGEWQKAGGDVLKDGGRVTLVFDPKDFLLVAIEGKNPFVPAEKQGK